jgi:predicted PurR-regulated permease PerM
VQERAGNSTSEPLFGQITNFKYLLDHVLPVVFALKATSIAHPLVHIHQKKIAPKIAAKIACVNGALEHFFPC